LTSIASATATYNPIALPNAGGDFDYPGTNSEYQLDVEMQSVGAPNAKELDLVLSPSSVVFQTGAQYVVNTLSSAVVVSTSLGDCESEEISQDGGIDTVGSDAYLLRRAVQQGLAEGQTWFAAAGDTGADDCNDTSSGTHNGFGGGNATVDFPCSLPEIVCMGGTQFPVSAPAAWNASGDLTAWQAEAVWNEGDAGGAGGGGESALYPKPSWQAGIGPKASDGVRDVPDLSLTASTANPGIAVYDCGSGQDSTCGGNTSGAGQMDIFGGTSVASPLAAGFFAHLAGQVGCKLGDVHATLYALGLAQQDGGAQPFHDVTSGDNTFPGLNGPAITGFAAGPGYDLASGWGSIDLAKLVDAWPACATGDGGIPLPGDDGGPVTPGGDAGTIGSSSGGGVTPDAGTPVNGAAGASASCSCRQAGVGSSGSGLAGCLAALLAALGLVTRARALRASRSSMPPA
jgi:subtilase family serine protease